MAQDAPDADTRRDRVVLSAGRVNYWGTSLQAVKPPAKNPVESVWVEPIQTPDGRYAPYVPPPQVLQFLENPTPETARSYLRWQSERIAKLRRAMELLESIGKSEQPKAEIRETKPEKLPAPQDQAAQKPSIELLYFKQANCPYCNLQDDVLAQLRASHPQLKVREVPKGTSPDLWRKHGVKVTPTIVVLDGETVRETFQGLAPLKQIVTALQQDTRNGK